MAAEAATSAIARSGQLVVGWFSSLLSALKDLFYRASHADERSADIDWEDGEPDPEARRPRAGR